MKVAIFSDIHCNLPAFEKVMEKLIAEKADQYICCGDICGYYYFQNEVIGLLLGLKNLIGIAGNHDKLFLDCLSDDKLLASYSEKYGNSFYALKEKVTAQSLKYLKGLPESYIDLENDFAVFHGSPRDHLNGYIYPTDPLAEFAGLPYKYVFLGHTHYPMMRAVGDITIINPGACGQPRDGGAPSYAILDTETGKSEIKRVEYSAQSLIAEIVKRQEKYRYLIYVLERRGPAQ